MMEEKKRNDLINLEKQKIKNYNMKNETDKLCKSLENQCDKKK